MAVLKTFPDDVDDAALFEVVDGVHIPPSLEHCVAMLEAS